MKRLWKTALGIAVAGGTLAASATFAETGGAASADVQSTAAARLDKVAQSESQALPVVPAAIAPYCANTYTSAIEPITLVKINEINNPSPATSSTAHEDFTSIIGTLRPGATYAVTMKSNTGGNFAHGHALYVDWNGDGLLTGADEGYWIGTITNSTGTDALSVTAYITVPATAVPGNTRLRAMTLFNATALSGLLPCRSGSGFGQSEDYTVTIDPAAAVPTLPLTATASFTPASGAVPTNTTLAITLGNVNTAPTPLTADFITALPAGMTLAANATTTCPGTFTGAFGGSAIALASGSSVPVGGCTISANVAVAAGGNYAVTAGPLTTAEGSASAVAKFFGWNTSGSTSYNVGFEAPDYTVGTINAQQSWQARTSNVANTTPATGTQHFSQTGLASPTTSTNPLAISPQFAVGTTRYAAVSAKLRISHTTNGGSWQFQPQDPDAGLLSTIILFNRTGNAIQAYSWSGGSGTAVSTGATFTPDTYFDFKLLIDRATNNVRLCKDGVQIYESTDGTGTTGGNNVSNMVFQQQATSGQTANNTFFADDLNISYTPSYNCDGSAVLRTVTPSVTGNGSISPNTAQTVSDGATPTFTLAATAGNHLVNVTGTCGGTLAGSSFTTAPVTADCTVIANFAPDVVTRTVTPSVGSGTGTITPSTPQTVNQGSTTTFTLAAGSGFTNGTVGGTCGGTLAGNVYTTNAITADCTVVANFVPVGNELVCSGPVNHTTLANGNGSYYNWITGVIVDDGASGPPGYHFNPYGSAALSFFWGSNTKNAGVATSTTGTTWRVLQGGDVIGPSSIFSRGVGNATNWITGNTDGYLGFSMDCSTLSPAPASGTCYGYAHMTATGTTGIPSKVIDYCYNKAGNPITIVPIIGDVAPTVAKAFTPASVSVSTNSVATITLNNANPAAATLTADLVDTLPAGLVASSATTTCGGTASFTAGTIKLASGATIPASGSCTISANVQSATAASYVNTIAAGALQTNKGNNAAAASATLTVNNGGDPNLVCDTPNHNMVATFDGSSINWITGVIDDVGNQIHWNPYDSGPPVGLSFFWPSTGGGGGVASSNVYSVLAPGATIGSSSTFIALTAQAATANWRAGADGYMGFKLTCPGGTCYGYANLKSTAPTGFPLTLKSYCYNKAAGTSITIPPGGVDVPPTVAKAFAPASVAVNTNSVATITLNNANATAATLSADLVDTLPSGLVASSATTTCGGTASFTAGTIKLASGATIPAGGSCTVTANVQSATAGSYVNTIAAGALQTNKGNNAAAASATLTVTGGGGTPTIAVTPTSLSSSQLVGASATKTLTIANSGGGTLTWTIAEDNSARPLPAMPASPHIAQPASEKVGAQTAAVPAAGDQTGKTSTWMAPLAALYDNGPLITNAGAGAGGKDASALQTGMGNTTYGSNASASAGFRVADNFTVPAGGWTVDKITFFAYQTGSTTTSTITGVNVRIWNGVPGGSGSTIVFGDTTTNRMASTAFSNIYRVLDTGLTDPNRPIMAVVATVGTTLPAGTYWVDWQLSGSLASGPWAPPVTIAGATGKPGANAMQFDGTAWVPVTDPGSTAAQDFPFAIEGTGGGAPACSSPTDIPWLSLSPTSGSNAGGTNTPVTVTFNSTGMAVGSYSGKLCVSSNDTAHALVQVPVSMTVTPPIGNNGIIRSSPLNHAIPATTLGTSLNIVTSAFNDSGPTSGDWDFNFWKNSNGLALFTMPDNQGTYVVDASGKAVVLHVGDVIGPSLTFAPLTGTRTVDVAAGWLAGTDAYLGVRFKCNGRLTNPVPATICYGYVHITSGSTAGFPATIVDTVFDGDGQAITITGLVGPPTVTKAFSPSTVTTGANSTATITLSHGNPTVATLTADLVDTLPAGLVASAATTTCGGTVSFTAGSVKLASGATIPAGGACTISATVSAAAEGSYVNTIAAGALQTTVGNNAAAASATLTVSNTQPFPSPYCSVTFPSAVEPITRVKFRNIDNSSPAAVGGSPALENFLSVAGGVVSRGGNYTMAVEGNTDGNFTTKVKAYIDWNHNGVFDADEGYVIGDIVNSTGTDGKQAVAQIRVPTTALVGPTRMRVIKRFSTAPDACNNAGFGQAEDYTLTVDSLPPAVPVASITPITQTFTAEQGASATGAMTISNAADALLTFSIRRALPDRNEAGTALSRERLARARNDADKLARSGEVPLPAALDLLSERYVPIGRVGPLASDPACDIGAPGIIVHDHGGTPENGYGWNPSAGSTARIVDKFTPTSYPATFNTACLSLLTNVGLTSAQIKVVVFADDGAGGGPGTQLGSVSATANNIGTGLVTQFQAFDISSMALSITGGSVYIGVEWDATSISGLFLGVDESSAASANGYQYTSSWAPIVDTRPNYRAMYIRAVQGDSGPPGVGCDAPSNVSWLSTNPLSGSVDGIGSMNVTVKANATGMAVGSYSALLCVDTNDPAHPRFEIPVTFNVTPSIAADRIFKDGFDGQPTGVPGVYTDRTTFLANAPATFYEENFANVPVDLVTDPLPFSGAGISYTVFSSEPYNAGTGSGGLYNPPGAISTNSASSKIVVTITSGTLKAIGGNFWATDITFSATGTTTTLTLSDGTVETYTSTGPSDFRGFVTTVPITKLEIDTPNQGATPIWPALDNLIVAGSN